jgi:neurotrimin
MVWVPQQLVGSPLGATVTIECWLEAHPAALHYWARPDGQLLHDPTKDASFSTPNMNPSSYMTHLKLTIRHLTVRDYGP